MFWKSYIHVGQNTPGNLLFGEWETAFCFIPKLSVSPHSLIFICPGFYFYFPTPLQSTFYRVILLKWKSDHAACWLRTLQSSSPCLEYYPKSFPGSHRPPQSGPYSPVTSLSTPSFLPYPDPAFLNLLAGPWLSASHLPASGDTSSDPCLAGSLSSSRSLLGCHLLREISPMALSLETPSGSLSS